MSFNLEGITWHTHYKNLIPLRDAYALEISNSNNAISLVKGRFSGTMLSVYMHFNLCYFSEQISTVLCA